MVTYELKPTFENLFDAFQNDTVGRNMELFRFVELLDAIDDGCALALDGNWGCGKTFFVKQSKMVMEAYNEWMGSDGFEKRSEIKDKLKVYNKNQEVVLQPQVCVYYDAWENDNTLDPVMSIIYTIMMTLREDFKIESDDFWGLGLDILEKLSNHKYSLNMNLTGMLTYLKSISPTEQVEREKTLENAVHEFLSSVIAERGNRLIIFVDELDRCQPSYAVKLLERIKHYFKNESVTFVFSVNMKELQHTVKRYYGEGFDGYKYLDRFFDLRMMLPEPKLDDYYRALKFDSELYTYDITANVVIEHYRLELREIAKYLRMIKIAAHEPTHSTDFNGRCIGGGRGTQFSLLVIIPIMIGLKFHDSVLYEDFINGKDASPLIEIGLKMRGRMFEELLFADETYDERRKDITVVKLEDKLNDVYNALFNEKNGTTRIGDIDFSSSVRDVLVRTANLLSGYMSW